MNNYTTTPHSAAEDKYDLLSIKKSEELRTSTDGRTHQLAKGIICATDYRAEKMSPLRIRVDATEGFIPLWAENLVLRWRFNEASLTVFEQPDRIKGTIRDLLVRAIEAWGDAAPIRFTENSDNSDFEIVVEQNDSCTPQGCTLAQAFFPDAGRHHLYVFPRMFGQNDAEQIETLVHELGHVFGLRHFFAPQSEARWPSEVFGNDSPFSIMNYGELSKLTDADRNDLKRLYKSAWNGTLKNINGTPIKLVRPFHYVNT